MKKSIFDAFCAAFVVIIGIIVIFIGIGKSDSKPNDKSKSITHYTENDNSKNVSDEETDNAALHSEEINESVKLQSSVYNEEQSAEEIIISVTTPAIEENSTILGEVNEETYIEVNH